MEPLERPADCDRLLVVFNPKSPLSDNRARANIVNLLDDYGDVSRVETFHTEKDRADTQQKLVRDLRPKDLLVVSTGDGGVNTVAEALITSSELKKDGRNKVPILPIQGGYINLGRKQLTPGVLEDPDHLAALAIRYGSIIDVNPLEITLTNEEEEDARQYIEVFCAGFGLTGRTIHNLESGGRRKSFREKNKLTRELASGIAVLRAFMSVEPFVVEHEVDSEAQSISVRELSFTNSGIVGRFRFPVKLTDPEFLVTTVPEKRSQAAFALGRLLVRHPKVERVKGFDSFTVTLQTTNSAKIKMQVGGERGEVSSGTNVTVRRHQDTVRFVTLNSKLQNDN